MPRSLRSATPGTLDPFATGLLLVLVGRGTRAQRFLMALPKRYEVVARFGAVSSTGDPEGEITETGDVPAGELTLPDGKIRQRPPAYSAVKVGGRRAYELARAGEEVELPEREVTVYRFEQLWREGDRRALRDRVLLGHLRPQPDRRPGDAYCLELRRTRIGDFDVADADPERLVALTTALAFLPEVALDGRGPPRGPRRRAVDAASPGGRHRPADRRRWPDRARRAVRGAGAQADRGFRGWPGRTTRLPARCRSRCSRTSRPARAAWRWASSTASISVTAR